MSDNFSSRAVYAIQDQFQNLGSVSLSLNPIVAMKSVFLGHVLIRILLVFHLTNRRLRRDDIHYIYEAKLVPLELSTVCPENATLKNKMKYVLICFTLNMESSGTRGLLSGFSNALNSCLTDDHTNYLTYGLGDFKRPSTLPCGLFLS